MKTLFSLLFIFSIELFPTYIVGEYWIEHESLSNTFKIHEDGTFLYEFRYGCWGEQYFKGHWQLHKDTLSLSTKTNWGIDEKNQEALKQLDYEQTYNIKFLVIPEGLKTLSTELDFFPPHAFYKKI